MGRYLFYGVGYGVPILFLLLSFWMGWSNLRFYEGSEAVAAEVTQVETRTEPRTRRVSRRNSSGEEVSYTESYTATIHRTFVRYPFGAGSSREGVLEIEETPVAVGDLLNLRYAVDDPDDLRLDSGSTGIWAGPLFLGIFFGLIPLGAVMFIASKFRN